MLARGEHQAPAFVEPKGLRLQWPGEKFKLREDVVPSWPFSVPVRGFVLSANTQAEIGKIQTGFTWDTAPSVLLHQDPDGAYVERLLTRLAALLPLAA